MRVRYWSAGLLLAVLLAAGCASTHVYTPPSTSAERATLAVVVTDALTGAPVPGAAVSLHTGEVGGTDGNGYHAFGGLALGGRGVTVRADGYRETFRGVDAFACVPRRASCNLQVPIALERSTGARPWSGRLSKAPGDRCFVDDTGACQLPIFAHFGEAFSAFVRRPADVERQLVAIKAAGYDGIRFWDTLGYYDNAWRGREVMPWAFRNRSGHQITATLQYYEQLRAFLGLLSRIGLTAHHSRGDLVGQPVERVVEHARRVAAIYDQVGWQTLALAEANNEDWQNGAFRPEGLRRIVQPFRDRGALTALSSPPNAVEEPELVEAYARGASVFYVHGYRKGESTDRLRHIFSLVREAASGTPRLGWQGEPTGPGPGVTVGRVDDAEELALLAAEALMARQAWVYMSSHGVFWNGPLESQPGFAAVPKIRGALQAFAPDVMSWRLTHGGSPDAALCRPEGCRRDVAYGDPGVRDGVERIDQAIAPDGRIVAIVHGGEGRKRIENWSGRALRISIVWADGESLRTEARDLAPGQILDLEYRVGRLLLAEPIR